MLAMKKLGDVFGWRETVVIMASLISWPNVERSAKGVPAVIAVKRMTKEQCRTLLWRLIVRGLA